MAKQTHLTITVGADGRVATNFFHFAGSTCLQTGRQLHTLLAELGLETEITRLTPKPELSEHPSALSLPQQETIQEGGRSDGH